MKIFFILSVTLFYIGIVLVSKRFARFMEVFVIGPLLIIIGFYTPKIGLDLIKTEQYFGFGHFILAPIIVLLGFSIAFLPTVSRKEKKLIQNSEMSIDELLIKKERYYVLLRLRKKFPALQTFFEFYFKKWGK
ncbi:MAG: hypothetical protein QME81_08305 [bacterium]|nr:hypothetical protein [bacterium]